MREGVNLRVDEYYSFVRIGVRRKFIVFLFFLKILLLYAINDDPWLIIYYYLVDIVNNCARYILYFTRCVSKFILRFIDL